LIRYSGTEPLLRILVEGRDTEQIKRKINELAAAIEEEIGV
jgi:phosphoglucosamine mutase